MNAKKDPTSLPKEQSNNTLGIDGLSTHPNVPSRRTNTELPIEFGRYRLLKVLGEGGMGAVYLAHDTELDRKVALKLPHFVGGKSKDQGERFRREARLAATLSHSNICRIFDIGEQDGRLFLTMEYVEGKTLNDIIKAKGAIEPRTAVNLVKRLASAVQVAHSQGIIHRDLKPANIMIKKDRDFVIMDFGLARRVEQEEVQLTATGAVLGTPAYMAPEQLRGENNAVGPQSDVYSLGIILYELLTGQRPFQGTLPQIYAQVLSTDSVFPSSIKNGLDATLDQICRKATSAHTDARYRTAEELAKALGGYLSGQPQAPADPLEMVPAIAEIHAPFASYQRTIRRPKSALATYQKPIAIGAMVVLAVLLSLGVILSLRSKTQSVDAPRAKTESSPSVSTTPTVSTTLTKPSTPTTRNISPPTGFTALFNGSDLGGWYGWTTRDPSILWAMSPEEKAKFKKQSIEGGAVDEKGMPTNEHLKAHWRVENQELVNDGLGDYLTTDKDYGDFELHLEYKALPKGDSGVYLRGIPQVQIWDTTEGDPRGLGQDKGSGGLWNNRKGSPGKDPSKKMDKPFGEWNSLKITMIGERVTVVLNGEKVVDHAVLENYFANPKSGFLAYGKPDPKKNEEITKIPSRTMLDPAFPKGPIQLQTHGSEIRWRNVFIREIGPEEANKILAARDSDGFVELINGMDLSNWVGAVDSYEVKEGAIVCKQGKIGDLLTKEEYENFTLRFEFRLPPAGNNGITFRRPLRGNPITDALEIQIMDSDGYNALHPKEPLLPHQCNGSLYYCIGAKQGFLRPTGQWNYEEIEVQGQNIKVTLNGTKILDVNIDELDRSQFVSLSKGLDNRKGHIGFAGHRDPVAFRSFKVKRAN